ncbi:hypothetical protein TcBrA4_0024270 [Trypanosoma cruzi]|nr:hypothetical protein TcBrA4_0024270 [Trypanosoma cruzi]
MHADDRTLVALCVDLRVCGAAMPAAVSVVATWSAEHCLRIDANGSGAALFCIASHRQSDEDTADHRLGGGNPRVKSHLLRLLGNAIDRLLNFGLHVTVAARQTVPLCHQPRLEAEAGASHHTMRSCLAGCVHTALHHGGEAVAPRPAHAQQRRMLLSTWPQSSTAAEDHWFPRTHTARTPHASPVYGGRAWRNLLGGHSVVNTLEGGDDYFAAGRCRPQRTATCPPPRAEQRVVARDTASRSGLGLFQPRHASDALDGVRRSAVEAAYASPGPCVWIRCAAT